MKLTAAPDKSELSMLHTFCILHTPNFPQPMGARSADLIKRLGATHAARMKAAGIIRSDQIIR